MNVVNSLEIFYMHVCIFGRIKKLQILFLGCLKNLNFLGQQGSLNSINKLLFDKLRVLNLYPKLLIIPLLLNFSIHSDLILSRCIRRIFHPFSDGVPMIFPNQSLFDEFQGITLNYCFYVC